jgi:hypothetical protein
MYAIVHCVLRWGYVMCKSLIDSIEESLIQLQYAVADYYSCGVSDSAEMFRSLEAPLRELCRDAVSTQRAIDLLRAKPRVLVDKISPIHW